MNIPYLPTLQKQPRFNPLFWLLILVMILLLIAILQGYCGAEEIDDTLAVKAIVGEASNQGYHGMLAVAVGIRNRGTLQGIYGLTAKHNNKEPQWVWNMAKKVWKESEYNRIHSGTHWESIDFPKPKWAYKMREAYRYKKHIFYKERGNK